MLSIRMIIFAGIAAICLWGLSTLLGNLQEPGLLRTQRGIALKGCASLDTHKDSARLCPALLCQKALVDRKLIDLQDQVDIAIDRSSGGAHLVAGRLGAAGQYFTCSVMGVTVKTVELISADEFAALSSSIQ